MPRKKLPDDIAKRVTLNTRTTQQLRDALQDGADGSGRSLAQEVEHRLEQSFVLDRMADLIGERMAALTVDFMIDTFGGDSDFAAGLAFAQILGAFREDKRLEWSDPDAQSQFLSYLAEVLPRLAAHPPALPSSRRVSEISKTITFKVAMALPAKAAAFAEEKAPDRANNDRDKAAGVILQGVKGFPIDEESHARRLEIDKIRAGKPRHSRKS